MKTVNTAVIGVGYWGPNIVRNLLSIHNVNVQFVCDKDREALSKFSKTYPLIKSTLNFEDVLNDSTIDLILIATPLSTHFKLASLALKANKHVFIEKPMTSTSNEAQKLIAQANEKKRTLMVGHTFIYSSPVRRINKEIHQKSFGDLYYYESTRINLGNFYTDTNVIWDLATHDLAILTYLLNKLPLSVYVDATRHVSTSQVDTAHLHLKYENNLSAHIHASWLSPVKIRSIILGGSKKMIMYNDIEPSEKLRIYKNNVYKNQVTPFSPAYRSGDVIIPKLSQEETLFAQLSHLIDSIRKERIPLSDGEHGLKVLKILEACDKSIKEKKEIRINE